jgi:tRNA dimethylallyltransferase
MTLLRIVAIVGPTAVGKTKVAIELARRFGGEIVSADSQQVWRGFDIGTAKANLKERSEVRHHLVDVVDPDEHFDAARFLPLADAAIEDIASRGKRVFVVGGTGMYVRMLERGLCEAPPQDPAFRKELEVRIEALGLAAIHGDLAKVDSRSAAAIHPNDHTRIVRALEIFELTGVPASELRESHSFKERRYDIKKIGLNIEREELYRRVDERVDRMVAEGLLEEVRSLLAKYDRSYQPFSAVGYREFVAHIKGEISLDEAVRLTKQQSRRFAKRQLTWFRADSEIEWSAPEELETIASKC